MHSLKKVPEAARSKKIAIPSFFWWKIQIQEKSQKCLQLQGSIS
jgi:hypothetical protein